MNKIVTFLIGVMMLVVVFIAMFFAGAIFDTSRRASIETYFFQVNNYSYQRPGMPLSPKQLGDSKLFDLLVQKYVTEYLYVLPEVADIDQRETQISTLNLMSYKAPNKKFGSAFLQWRETIAPEIRKLAEAGVLRTVVVGTPLKYGDFYRVEFTLYTWAHPNDMDEVPTQQSGIMQFKLALPIGTTEYRPEIIEEKLNTLHWAIDNGYDSVGVFNFMVSDAILYME